MENSNQSHLNILDLSDEILCQIFQGINTIDRLGCIANVNRRFFRLAIDHLAIRRVDLTQKMMINSTYDQTCSINPQVLSHICQNILPHISHHIHELILEPQSMQLALNISDYPQLYSLSFINFEEDDLVQYLTDHSILRDLLANQITHLTIDIKSREPHRSCYDEKLFGLIVSLCKNLTVFNSCQLFSSRECETYVLSARDMSLSSTLVTLKINVFCYLDCLALLDGHLENLSTFIVNVSNFVYNRSNINRLKTAATLKHFSFTLNDYAVEYDNAIVPLLRSMINLEELNLYLNVYRIDLSYIDGQQMYDDFLISMTYLKKFTFNIKTTVEMENIRVALPSNEELQRTFVRKIYPQVASFIDETSTENIAECQIYSLPYPFDIFIDLNNFFQGGIFNRVRYVKMDDTLSFEHQFFELISQSFPSLQSLHIYNNRLQKIKQQPSVPIIFPQLTYLNLFYAHTDYAEQFLLTRNTHLPRLLNLCMSYKSLTTITGDFMIDPSQFNFRTLTNLDVCEIFIRRENFPEYFPNIVLSN